MNSDDDNDIPSPGNLPINPPGIGPFDKDPDDDIPFLGFEEDPEE
jgi:hypothetical protein